ncbi:hypothetical protein ACFQZS_08945 [Mucilaginibacter calamicampi]|uniref:Barstar (barnase inhibitor) domain-containing protein n=1 Tax=Mucilaginibacter calamicampi TaxID=1302352 RepID=A0ABW2YXA1_9SPHI
MKIYIKKVSHHRCEYKLKGEHQDAVISGLDVKTYLIHDITHFVVEQNLEYTDGFWGMLAQGYSFTQLAGKQNELTPGLRAIEKIVGPVQSVYMGFITIDQFDTYTSHLDVHTDIHWLKNCIESVENIYAEWEKLKPGEEFFLVWPLHK